MTFTDLETILRQAGNRYAAAGTLEGNIVAEAYLRLAQDIRDFIEAEKAEAEGKKS